MSITVNSVGCLGLDSTSNHFTVNLHVLPNRLAWCTLKDKVFDDAALDFTLFITTLLNENYYTCHYESNNFSTNFNIFKLTLLMESAHQNDYLMSAALYLHYKPLGF